MGERFSKRVSRAPRDGGLRSAPKRPVDRCKVDERPVAIHRRKLEYISKLSDVARPWVRAETFECLGLEATLADFRLHEAKEMACEGRDVIGANAQWRDLDDEAVDSIV
jgi:hypothetical protein